MLAVIVGIATLIVTHGDSAESRKIALESFTAVQRAFLTVGNVKITQSVHDPMPGLVERVPTITFIPVVTNSGHTPAIEFGYAPFFVPCNFPLNQMSILGAAPITTAGRWQNVQLGLNCIVRDGIPTPPDPDTVRVQQIMAAHQAMLGPQSSADIGGMEISDEAIKEFGKHNISIFLYGVIRYRDIFPRSQPHITKYYYEIGSRIKSGGSLSANVSFCQHWNCADRQCEEDKAAYQHEVTLFMPR